MSTYYLSVSEQMCRDRSFSILFHDIQGLAVFPHISDWVLVSFLLCHLISTPMSMKIQILWNVTPGQLVHTDVSKQPKSISNPTWIAAPVSLTVWHLNRTRDLRVTNHSDFFITVFMFATNSTAGPGSSVGIATAYGLDSPGIESRWGARFSVPVQTGPEARPTSCIMGTGSFPGVRCGRGVTLTPHPLPVPRSKTE